MKRVGFLTSGGDCQALNATMRGVAKGLYQIYKDEVEIIGFEDGYKGLMYANYLMMKQSDFSGVLTKGRNDARYLQTAVQADACARTRTDSTRWSL